MPSRSGGNRLKCKTKKVFVSYNACIVTDKDLHVQNVLRFNLFLLIRDCSPVANSTHRASTKLLITYFTLCSDVWHNYAWCLLELIIFIIMNVVSSVQTNAAWLGCSLAAFELALRCRMDWLHRAFSDSSADELFYTVIS